MRGHRAFPCHPVPFAVFVVVLLHAAVPAGATTAWDLTADWSDAANPNGAWSWREGANPLPHVSAWQGLSGDFTSAQPAWARFDVGTSNLPCFFRSSASVGITHDWQTGDVVCHSTDGFNGIGSGAANVDWTSPVTGIVNVTGAVWMGRDIGRGNRWAVSRNGVELTAGTVASGDPYSRANPMTFDAGSGGLGALTGLPVNVGDVIALTLTKTASPGDYSGLRMHVELVQPSAVGAPRPALQLDPPDPNPARSRTRIRYAVPRAGTVRLEVYDVAGARIARLVDGPVGAGDHEVLWTGGVRAGRYFVRLSSAEGERTRPLVVVR